MSDADRSRLYRQRKADRARHTGELIAELIAAAPPSVVARLSADERFKDILTEALNGRAGCANTPPGLTTTRAE